MKTPVYKLSTVIVLISISIGCAVKTTPSKWSLPPKSEGEISFMSFNIENLFDTEHDEGKNDYAYLPKALKKKNAAYREACEDNDSASRIAECLNTDYSEDVVEAKMKNISKIILGVDEIGPDILIVLEVENIKILNRLNNEYLQKAGYKTVVLIEGEDKRGIDVGLLSRLPLAGTPELHKVNIVKKEEEKNRWADTRGILQVPLKLPNGETLNIYGAHFPSQANPRHWREQALTQLVQRLKGSSDSQMAIAGGDLNITAEEEDEAGLFKKIATPNAWVSHFIGCKDCPGTHNYRKSWSFLDAHLYSKALQSEGLGSYRIIPETVDVIRYNEIHLNRGKYPNRWDNTDKSGVSDHFPLYVRLKKK